jgi:hypothetical protein
VLIVLSRLKGEQTYCRKQLLDKTPKVLALYFAEFFSEKPHFGTKCQKLKNSHFKLKMGSFP